MNRSEWSISVLVDFNVLFFAFACGVVSLLVLFADWVSVSQLNRNSQLGISYKNRAGIQWVWLLWAWWGAAAIVGYLAVMTNILQMSNQTMVTIGLSWPVVYYKLFVSNSPNEGLQPPKDKLEARGETLIKDDKP